MNSATRTTEIKLTRTVEATPEEVFDAWLDPENPGSPFCGVTRSIVARPEVDGLFYSMYLFEGQEVAHYGRFVALERGRTIRHTWVSRGTGGLESLVTLSLEPEGDKTLVQVHHTGVPDDEEGRRHRHAWGYVLGRMSSHFSKEKIQ